VTVKYPTVTEKAVPREGVVHDPFIDGLATPRPAVDATPSRAARHPMRRRSRRLGKHLAV